MHYSEIPEKPLIAGMSQRNEQVEPIFFFERSDGEILYVQEREAWGLYSRQQQRLGSPRLSFRLIGTGDGVIFRDAVSRAKEVGKTDIRAAQDIIRIGVNDELDACRGKIRVPRNMDQIG